MVVPSFISTIHTSMEFNFEKQKRGKKKGKIVLQNCVTSTDIGEKSIVILNL